MTEPRILENVSWEALSAREPACSRRSVEVKRKKKRRRKNERTMKAARPAEIARPPTIIARILSRSRDRSRLKRCSARYSFINEDYSLLRNAALRAPLRHNRPRQAAASGPSVLQRRLGSRNGWVRAARVVFRVVLRRGFLAPIFKDSAEILSARRRYRKARSRALFTRGPARPAARARPVPKVS